MAPRPGHIISDLSLTFPTDEEKKRYFKVESSRTAPTTSSWSSDNVKKRRLESQEAAAVLQRLSLEKGRLKRSRLMNDALIGGVYAREYGLVRRDVQEAGYAKGIVEKGIIPLADARWRSSTNVRQLCVIGADTKTGLGVAYATLDELLLFSTYIPRDRNGRVHRQLLANYNTPRGNPYSELAVSQLSDIKFHKPSTSVLVSSRAPGREMSLWLFKPVEAPSNSTNTTPQWLLGWGTGELESPFTNVRIPGHNRKITDYQINVIAPGPAASSTVCGIGSNRGILQWDAERDPKWLAPSSRATTYAEIYRDIFALEFLNEHPSILLAGGRPGHLSIKDVRDRNDDTRDVSRRLGSPITHIKSLNEHHVLVSGLKNSMAVYDVRMMRSSSSSSSRSDSINHNNNARANRHHPTFAHVLPLIQFPEYRNGPHIQIGLDVDKDNGIVAAAHDDGKVAVYSTKTGHRLKSPDIDQIRSHRGVIQALQFETMPRDSHPTIFVGNGSNLHAYSFGVRNTDDEV
ncbi:hypothetical protein PG993_007574 [Apiospora rasikravindrae]|uniref:Myocyte-specific enhancer factor 2d n=1 Tax=Apiospora rasikravindrae TaxID=990691 RepID=A0ABR1SXX3_9PEZI